MNVQPYGTSSRFAVSAKDVTHSSAQEIGCSAEITRQWTCFAISTLNFNFTGHFETDTDKTKQVQERQA